MNCLSLYKVVEKETEMFIGFLRLTKLEVLNIRKKGEFSLIPL